MIRATLGDSAYWNKWVDYGESRLIEMVEILNAEEGDKNYRPQYTFQLAQENWTQMLSRYSRGDSIHELAQYFPPLLNAWEEAERLGKAVWTQEQQYTRHTWAVNYDHYIICFWLVGLALALEVPDDQWQRLLALIGNDGEDALLDRIIASRSPNRKIGSALCYKKPYARLLAALDAPAAEQSQKLKEFVEHWYKEVGAGAKSGRAAQAVPYPHPYWYKYGDSNFEGGAYFGRWCVEAVAAVKAFGLDDSACLGHEHYPGDLLRPNGPSTHPLREEPALSSAPDQPEPSLKRGLLARILGRGK